MTENTKAVQEAKVVRAVAIEIVPVVASAAMFGVGIWKQNLALISAAAGLLGIPGMAKVAQTIKKGAAANGDTA